MYYEMAWDVHSWVPLVSRLFPSDTLKIWKSDQGVRLDTTLLNVSENSLKRGQRTYLISINEETEQVEMVTIDHESDTFATEVLFQLPTEEDKAEIATRYMHDADMYMHSELQDVDLTTDKVTFQPAQSGWIGWRRDRTEEIAERVCRVYNINGLDVVQVSRTEHLSEEDMRWNKQHRKNLQAGRVPPNFEFPVRQSLPPPQRPRLSFDEYAAQAAGTQQGGAPPPHLGRPMRTKSHVKHLKGMVWVCDSDAWPLSTNVLLKLLTVLAPAGAHLQKVEDFLQTTMPPGFPIKLDVPVFPTVSARVTSSVCRPGPVSPDLFAIPATYLEISVEEMEDMHDEDEEDEEFEIDVNGDAAMLKELEGAGDDNDDEASDSDEDAEFQDAQQSEDPDGSDDEVDEDTDRGVEESRQLAEMRLMEDDAEDEDAHTTV